MKKQMMLYVYAAVLVVISVAVVLAIIIPSIKIGSRPLSQPKVPSPPNDIPMYLNHKTKSFDAERETRLIYGDDGAWLGQPSKLYAAEAQGVHECGLSCGFIGKTVKYY